jgi:hypothetical protein
MSDLKPKHTLFKVHLGMQQPLYASDLPLNDYCLFKIQKNTFMVLVFRTIKQ